MNRRLFLGQSTALALLAGLPTIGSANLKNAHIVVVGGGYGGATASKYLRLFSNNTAKVTLIEPNSSFMSCPLSNLVVGGSRTLSELTTPYDNLQKRHGIRLIKDLVTSIDGAKKTLKLASGTNINYDKLVLSPGISMMMDQVEGLVQANLSGTTIQAWKAGPETTALHQQLASMQDGGVYAITIPEAPYRCPPGPYERACQVASYFKQHKPKSKVLVLDANQDIVSKAGLFKKAWAEEYPGMIEYRPKHNVVAVDAKTKTIKFDVQDDVKADVLNILPMMRAGDIALKTGVLNANNRWAQVNYLNFESTAIKDIHVLGDSIQIAPLMPKSAHMANSHAKVAAAAIVAELNAWEINPAPVLTNTCYSFIDSRKVVHVASVHQYNSAEKTFKTVPGSGGLSSEANVLEGIYAWGWAKNIWADSLA